MTKYNPVQVREDLLNAVGQLLLSAGIAELSVQKIAEHAGVTKGALFHHFKNKDELLQAFFQQILDSFEADISFFLQDIENPNYADFLTAYTRASFHHLDFSRDSLVWVLQYLSYQDYKWRWQDWLNQSSQKKVAVGEPTLKQLVLKCAVDGLWLNLTLDSFSTEQTLALQNEILREIAQPA